MKNSLILHGWEGNSESHWIPWLREEFTSLDYKVYSPSLPDTTKPNISDQLNCINKYKNKFDWNDFIVWHSLWWILALKFIQDNNISWINVILVAPAFPRKIDTNNPLMKTERYKYVYDYYNTNIDFDNINWLWNNYHILLSDDDPFIDIDLAKDFYSKLKYINFIPLSWRWHFNTSAKIFKITEILDIIKWVLK